MNIFIDIETLRSDESHKIEILENIKANFKAPSTLTKAKAAKDLGLTDKDEIKFTPAGDMIARWESEMAEIKSVELARKEWERTSFDPHVAPIACICISFYDHEMNLSRKAFSQQDFNSNERDMLFSFHSYLNDLLALEGGTSLKPFFVGHYISNFDLPFIFKRSIINGVRPVRSNWINGRHGVDYFDTMTAWSGYKGSVSMDNLAKALGIKGKGDIDGSMVYDTWHEDPKKVIDYCHDDVRMVKEIYEAITM